MPLEHWLQLALAEGIGPILQGRLIEAAGDAERACSADISLLRQVEGIGPTKAQQFHDALRSAAIEVPGEIARTERGGVSLICRDDDRYPHLLREIPDPPAVLYLRGTLEPRDLHAVGIVGSRRCSLYGREQSERFAAVLAGAGITVVSGGARGIDSAAHRGAMSHSQGRTIAVLGSGIDVPYPPENARLFEEIAHRGAVISEYPMGTPPLKDNFPRRNRIISGLSRGVLVIEADLRSGALITARQACDDHGRPVFALPGRVDNRMSAGPHKLIRDGATLVTCIEEIVEALGPVPHGAMEASLFPAGAEPQPEPADSMVVQLSDRQRAIVGHLSADPIDVDSIIERTLIPAQVVMQELTMLSLKGVARRIEGQMFVRCGRAGSAVSR